MNEIAFTSKGSIFFTIITALLEAAAVINVGAGDASGMLMFLVTLT